MNGRCFDNGYVGKQPLAWKKILCGVLVKRTAESMDRCTGRRDITEILLKMAVNTIRSINQFVNGGLTFFLLMTTQEAFVDSVDQDQTAQNVQSDL